MVPSSYQRYFNGTSTVFQRYFDAFIAKNYRLTNGEREKNDWGYPYPTVVGIRDETCQALVFFSKSDDRFEVAKPYMVMRRRKGCSTAHATEKEKT
jgi:hypothetical protein